jgi:hypothetical protein
MTDLSVRPKDTQASRRDLRKMFYPNMMLKALHLVGQPGTALATVMVRHDQPGYQAQRKTENVMAWDLLLTSDIGLMSLFTILFMVAMAAYLYRYAVKHAAEDAKHSDVGNQVPHSH